MTVADVTVAGLETSVGSVGGRNRRFFSAGSTRLGRRRSNGFVDGSFACNFNSGLSDLRFDHIVLIRARLI